MLTSCETQHIGYEFTLSRSCRYDVNKLSTPTEPFAELKGQQIESQIDADLRLNSKFPIFQQSVTQKCRRN